MVAGGPGDGTAGRRVEFGLGKGAGKAGVGVAHTGGQVDFEVPVAAHYVGSAVGGVVGQGGLGAGNVVEGIDAEFSLQPYPFGTAACLQNEGLIGEAVGSVVTHIDHRQAVRVVGVRLVLVV